MKNLFPIMHNEGEPFSRKEKVLSFFYPDLCAACKEAGYRDLCPRCHEKMEQYFRPRRYLCQEGNGFADDMLALFPYDCIPAKKIMLAWKNHSFREFSRVMGHYLERASAQKCFFRGIDRVTFVPRQGFTRFLAGFDQAEQIAELVAHILGLPLERLLARKGFRPPQRKLSKEEREDNVRGVFHSTIPLQGETVLLVDDVVTTGASARECARILKRAGAQRVYVLSIAHPFPREDGDGGMKKEKL